MTDYLDQARKHYENDRFDMATVAAQIAIAEKLTEVVSRIDALRSAADAAASPIAVIAKCAYKGAFLTARRGGV